MTIARVNPILTDLGSPSAARPTPEAGADFAAVARSVAAGDLDGARKALAAAGTPATSSARTLAQTLADGNLAAARFALGQLGAPAHDPHQAAASGPDVTLGPPPPVPGPGIPGAPGPTVVPQKDTIAAVQPPLPPATTGMVVADVGMTANGAIANGATANGATANATIAANAARANAATANAATANATMAANPAPGAMVTSSNGNSYALSDVLLALALGNAGSIPADVINRYGPGGPDYDPAAIMDAYRNSPLGKAQIAALSWIGRPV